MKCFTALPVCTGSAVFCNAENRRQAICLPLSPTQSPEFINFSTTFFTIVMIILVLILIGIAAGYALRRVKALKNVNRTITVTICFMVFMLGLTVGNNSELLGNIGNYGWQALLICCAGLAGSILFTITVNAMFFKGSNTEKEGGGNE